MSDLMSLMKRRAYGLEGLTLERARTLHDNALAEAMAEKAHELEIKNRELEVKSEKLENLAVTDGLTGLLNRRAHDNIMSREVSRASRSGEDLGFLMLDIDYFKKFNDTYGHAAGDEVLKNVAEIYQGVASRETDVVTRYGGEEFAVILPGTDHEGALKVAYDINRKVSEEPMKFVDESGKVCEERVKVSVGVANYVDGDSVESISKRADGRLYEAKDAGRDCVVGGEGVYRK
ncbi:GGDEF domain-containing protein [Methanococcoides sp. SA1]|nr:GGDEF domain-containing protein [Methanococcoides sp. SA1]